MQKTDSLRLAIVSKISVNHGGSFHCFPRREVRYDVALDIFYHVKKEICTVKGAMSAFTITAQNRCEWDKSLEASIVPSSLV